MVSVSVSVVTLTRVTKFTFYLVINLTFMSSLVIIMFRLVIIMFRLMVIMFCFVIIATIFTARKLHEIADAHLT